MPLLGVGPRKILTAALSAGFQEAWGTLPAMDVATKGALLTPGNVITFHSGTGLTQTRPACEEVTPWVPAFKSSSASSRDISHLGGAVAVGGASNESDGARHI